MLKVREKLFPQESRKPWLFVNSAAKRRGEAAAMESSKQARISPLSLLLWAEGPAASGGGPGGGAGASCRLFVTKAELRSSAAAAQFLALGLAWNWDETLVLGAIWAKLCLDLKLTWAVLSAVRSHEENSFSSSDGPGGVNEEQPGFNKDQIFFCQVIRFCSSGASGCSQKQKKNVFKA